MTKMEINLIRDCLDCIEYAEECLAWAKTQKALFEEIGDTKRAKEFATTIATWKHMIEENKNEIKSLL